MTGPGYYSVSCVLGTCHCWGCSCDAQLPITDGPHGILLNCGFLALLLVGAVTVLAKPSDPFPGGVNLMIQHAPLQTLAIDEKKL